MNKRYARGINCCRPKTNQEVRETIEAYMRRKFGAKKAEIIFHGKNRYFPVHTSAHWAMFDCVLCRKSGVTRAGLYAWMKRGQARWIITHYWRRSSKCIRPVTRVTDTQECIKPCDSQRWCTCRSLGAWQRQWPAPWTMFVFITASDYTLG